MALHPQLSATQDIPIGYSKASLATKQSFPKGGWRSSVYLKVGKGFLRLNFSTFIRTNKDTHEIDEGWIPKFECSSTSPQNWPLVQHPTCNWPWLLSTDWKLTCWSLPTIYWTLLLAWPKVSHNVSNSLADDLTTWGSKGYSFSQSKHASKFKLWSFLDEFKVYLFQSLAKVWADYLKTVIVAGYCSSSGFKNFWFLKFSSIICYAKGLWQSKRDLKLLKWGNKSQKPKNQR